METLGGCPVCGLANVCEQVRNAIYGPVMSMGNGPKCAIEVGCYADLIDEGVAAFGWESIDTPPWALPPVR